MTIWWRSMYRRQINYKLKGLLICKPFSCLPFIFSNFTSSNPIFNASFKTFVPIPLPRLVFSLYILLHCTTFTYYLLKGIEIMKSEKEKMLDGDFYNAGDEQLINYKCSFYMSDIIPYIYLYNLIY